MVSTVRPPETAKGPVFPEPFVFQWKLPALPALSAVDFLFLRPTPVIRRGGCNS